MILKPAVTRIGLALGGGAMLGAAHVGVLKALRDLNLKVTSVSGTSIGALVAALYAFDVPVNDIEAIALGLDWQDIGALKLSKMGLFSNENLGKLIKDTIGDVSIEQASKKLAIIATDICTGQAVCLREGSVASAVMASSCVPGVFAPVVKGNLLLVDGGLVENVPISALEKSDYDRLIAVDLSTHRHYSAPHDVFDVIANAIDIAIDSHTRSQLRRADYLIQPDLTTVSRINASRDDIQSMIEKGHQTALKTLSKHTGWRAIVHFIIRCFRSIFRRTAAYS